jgi:hypothetical protein
MKPMFLSASLSSLPYITDSSKDPKASSSIRTENNNLRILRENSVWLGILVKGFSHGKKIARALLVIQKSTACGYGRDMGGIWEGYGRDMGGIWEGYGRDMGGIWEGYGRDMGGIWEGYGRDMGGIWEGYGRDMGGIWEAIL